MLLVSFVYSSFFSVLAEEGFYNIAHMVNTISAVDWAIGRGANGVEIDLQFNHSTGDLLGVRHEPPCGCTCVCPPLLWHLCEFATDHVCAVLYNDVKSGSPCNAGSTVHDMFSHIASKREISFLYLDSKVDSSSMGITAMQNAGQNVIKAVNNDLFGNGYGGRAVVGAFKFDALPFLKEAIGEANKSKYRQRIYFTIEGEKNRIVEVLTTLHSFPTQNIVYGTGLSSCVQGSPVTNDTLDLATINKVKHVTGMSYIWTVDSIISMKSHLSYVQGIITNYPGYLYDLLRESGIKLATQASAIPTSTSSDIVANMTGYDCNCRYNHDGCSVDLAANKGLACKCLKKTETECEGTIVQCHNPEDSHCRVPDTSVYSCLQGSGNCQGYETSSCSCVYGQNGCAISRAPPANIACRCIQNNSRSCYGEITRCLDENSHYCKTPDTSIHTCVLGGGNCDGYRTENCACGYRNEGCYISEPAPQNTACKCLKQGGGGCAGEIVDCLDLRSRYCATPDNSVYSCFQGNGNCEGYETDFCDCATQNDGCVISKAPPTNTTCRCGFSRSWTCYGEIGWCRDPNNYYCLHPDTSKHTCIFGGGNCSGYM